MIFEELQEALEELLPGGFSIEEDNHGQLIVYTNMKQDEDGELSTFEEEEIDPSDLDPDLDPLDEIDDED
jgi:hypothetical protein